MARIIVLLVLSQTALAWAQIDCRNRLTATEVLICATPELLQLDQWLGAAYRSALKATSDPRALRTDQRKWLRERDQCSRYDCLEPLYRSRIAELQRFQGEILALSERPPTRQKAAQVCAKLARHIDTNSIDEVLIPVHLTNPDQASSRPLSSVEEVGLSAMNKWPAYHDRAVVYELKFGDKRTPARLANFWGRRDCRSARMFNLDRYFASDGTDSGRDPGGVIDLETEIALSTAEDRLVALEGRYFVFTGSAQVPRPSSVWPSPGDTYMSSLEGSASIVSWVRPSGDIEPICILRTEARSLVQKKSVDRAVCEARVAGRLPLAEWHQEVLNPDDCCPRPLANPDDGDDPVAAYSTEIGADALDTPYVLVRLAYGPGDECGSVRVSATTVYRGFREVARTDLLGLVQPIYTGKATWPDIYRLGDRTFVEVGKSRDVYELMEITRGRLRKVCEFQRQFSTRVARQFDASEEHLAMTQCERRCVRRPNMPFQGSLNSGAAAVSAP